MEKSHAERSVFGLMARAPSEAERHLIQRPLSLSYRNSRTGQRR
jgi:hypothetical protein